MIDLEPAKCDWDKHCVEGLALEIINRKQKREGYMSIQEWVKKHNEELRLEQERVNNNPDAFTLYTYEVDIDTLECKSDSFKVEDNDEECTGYASFEESLDGSRVYAESMCSAQDARKLVRDFCEKFFCAMLKIDRDNYDG